MLKPSLTFKGDCSIKTGADGSKFGAEYIDHLLQSFETQTWVYEQASGETTSLLILAPRFAETRMDHVDVEDGTSGGLVNGDWDHLW